MRSYIIVIVCVIVCTLAFLSVPAFARDSSDSKFSVTAEEGLVFLSEDNPNLDDGIALGGTIGYRFRPHIELRLPVLFSLHDDMDLPEGQSAELSLFSITPGVAFYTQGRLAFWVFLGGGLTILSNKFEEAQVSTKERDTAVASHIGAGADFNVWRTLSLGVGGSVMTATHEVDQIDGTEQWETFFYYTALGRIVYGF